MGRLDVRLNCELFEGVDCFKYLGSQVVDGGECERDVVHKMNEVYKAWRALKSVLKNRRMVINEKKCLYMDDLLYQRSCTEQRHGV